MKTVKSILDSKNSKYKFGNVAINDFKNGYKEMLIYNQAFSYKRPKKSTDLKESREVKRNFIFSEDKKAFVCLNDNYTILDLQVNQKHSRVRALDHIYGYTKSNHWSYFLTLTFDPKKINSFDIKEIKEVWRKFRNILISISEDVKMFAIPEQHISGRWHLHVLIDKIDFTPFLLNATDSEGNPILDKLGNQIFNLSLFNFGFNTVAKISDEPNSQFKVCNYVTKYITKASHIGYNEKRYYSSKNLIFKEKNIIYCNNQELLNLCISFNFDKSINFFGIDSKDYICVPRKDSERLLVFEFFESSKT